VREGCGGGVERAGRLSRIPQRESSTASPALSLSLYLSFSLPKNKINNTPWLACESPALSLLSLSIIFIFIFIYGGFILMKVFLSRKTYPKGVFVILCAVFR